MSRAAPDAWEDDWETLADKQPAKEEAKPAAPKKLTKAEKRALHVQQQKLLWETAENPEPEPIFVAAKGPAPFQSDFKPAMKLLSRKPQSAPKMLARNDMNAQLGNMDINDDDDSEEEERKRKEASFAERQAKAKNLEERQREYERRRAEIFRNSETAPAEKPQGRASPQNRSSRGKGKGRAQRNGEASSSADQSPARNGEQRKSQLFDPTYSPKPNSLFVQRRAAGENTSRPGTPTEAQIIRPPRNPDSSGRGGFGFAPRGNRIGGAV